MKSPPLNLRRKAALVPDKSGVYLMRDAAGEIIYVGKAASLKKRLSSYFAKSGQDAKTRALVGAIEDFEYILTDSEIEALLLESSLIKKHRPKFNVRLKDDKKYPYIAVTLNEEYPRVIFTRKLIHNGNRYFGPYTDAGAARIIIAMINGTFKLKACTRSLPLKANERPCINSQMNRCSGPCRGTISRDEYISIIENAVRFLEGSIEPVIGSLTSIMEKHSRGFDYEKAALIRDMISDIQKFTASQKVLSPIDRKSVV